MTLVHAYRVLDKVATKERHMLLVVDLARKARDRAEAARLLRIAVEIRQEARDEADRATLALAAGH